MLENSYLKSQFYKKYVPDLTFSNSFKHQSNDIALNNEMNLNNLDYAKKIKTSLLYAEVPDKEDIHSSLTPDVYSDLGTQNLNNSLKRPFQARSRHNIKRNIPSSSPEKAISHSFEGLRNDDSEYIRPKFTTPHKKKPLKIVIADHHIYPRVSTPTFKENKEQSLDELKYLCEKLIFEQEKMKKKLKNQEIIIKRLNNDKVGSPMKINSNLPMIKQRDGSVRVRSIQIAIPKPYENLSFSLNKGEMSKPHNELWSLYSQIASPKYQIDENFDKILNTKPYPSKYYKDQPKIKHVLRFPKEVFTPK
jgi:hypothetical protein